METHLRLVFPSRLTTSLDTPIHWPSSITASLSRRSSQHQRTAILLHIMQHVDMRKLVLLRKRAQVGSFHLHTSFSTSGIRYTSTTAATSRVGSSSLSRCWETKRLRCIVVMPSTGLLQSGLTRRLTLIERTMYALTRLCSSRDIPHGTIRIIQCAYARYSHSNLAVYRNEKVCLLIR